MSNYAKLFERAGARYEASGLSTEGLLRRRDRKRQNRHILAGAVGLTVSVAAVSIISTMAALGDAQAVGVPGRTESGWVFDPSEDFVGLPPAGSRPSRPEEGELVAKTHAIHVGWVYVYADGRVISWSEGTYEAPRPYGHREQRLTSEGVELVRSGALSPEDFICLGAKFTDDNEYGCHGPLHDVPASAWEDAELHPYMPFRYAICGVAGNLPTAAQHLLHGKERTFDVSGPAQENVECFDVSTEEARTLDQILSDAGFWIPNPRFGMHSRVSPGSDPIDWDVWIQFQPVLPHGTFADQPG